MKRKQNFVLCLAKIYYDIHYNSENNTSEFKVKFLKKLNVIVCIFLK